MTYSLFERFPSLAPVLPAAGLLRGPTAVQSLGEGLWLKRDDLSAADYGGNKIRKLDFLLAAAKAAGVGELLTFGYAGSNFVAATAWHGRALGLDTRAFLLPQVKASYVADNLAVGLHAGARLSVHGSDAAIALAAVTHSAGALLRRGKLPYWIPPGGSSVVGVMGFVNAALELKAQVDAGLLPQPETIHVAFSSMGTVAGLALGLELAGMPTRIVAVQVVDERFASAAKLDRLMRAACARWGHHEPALAGLAERSWERVQIRREYFGEEYGKPTAQTLAAMERFSAASGARADSAYSGKALAGFYDDLDAGRLKGPALFWHTFNGQGLPAGVTRPAMAPVALRDYF